jgi:hypothetical protein
MKKYISKIKKIDRVFLVDVDDVIRIHEDNPNLHLILPYLSISEIIQASLITFPYNDDGEYLWSVLEAALDTALEGSFKLKDLDYEQTAIGFDQVKESLDRKIKSTVSRSGIDSGYLLFGKWINPFTLMLYDGS